MWDEGRKLGVRMAGNPVGELADLERAVAIRAGAGAALGGAVDST